jgi:hypothetical protein
MKLISACALVVPADAGFAPGRSRAGLSIDGRLPARYMSNTPCCAVPICLPRGVKMRSLVLLAWFAWRVCLAVLCRPYILSPAGGRWAARRRLCRNRAGQLQAV